jgi:hypothetical protein
MTCPICKSELYEKERRELTTGTFISIRCANPGCGYFDYKTLPVNPSGTISEQKKEEK